MQVQGAISAFARANPGTSALVWRIDDSGGRVPVASFRPDTPRIPASTMKLVTSAGALIELGPSFRFQTHLSAAHDDASSGAAS